MSDRGDAVAVISAAAAIASAAGPHVPPSKLRRCFVCAQLKPYRLKRCAECGRHVCRRHINQHNVCAKCAPGGQHR